MAAHGRYSLLHKIAEGGTAEVFLAHQLGSAGFKRLVVLKRVRPGLWADESFRRMLIDEAHISMALHHGNIVQVLDLGMSGAHYFLVFELVDGWSLSQVVKRARAAHLELPLNLALHVMAQVCRALAYAHSRSEGGVPMGIVHRDISPQNVLLSDQGEVKLADFGIAKARSRITTSQIGQVKGKPAYMSPEQAVGAPLDARSDLFSMGTCLYWLVTGELPFSAPNELEALARVVHGSYVPPEKKRSGLPKPIAKLITRALQHEPKERFQTADEMLAELEKIQRSTVLPPAGQTELKAWLDALAAKDGARPIGWVEEAVAKEPAPASDRSEEIELLDDADLVAMASQASNAVPAPPRPQPPARGWTVPKMLAVSGVALGVLGAAYWVTRSRELPHPAPLLPVPPSTTTMESREAAAPLHSALPESPVEPSDSGGVAEEQTDAGVADSGEAEVDAGVFEGNSAVEEGGADAGGADEADSSDGGEPPGESISPDAGTPDAAVEQPPGPAAVVETPPKPASPMPPKATERPRPAPKPAAVATPEMVSVLVETDPPGADVSIERRVFGRTPMPLKLKVGITFELALSKPGYRPQKVLYQVTSRQGQRVRVVLTR